MPSTRRLLMLLLVLIVVGTGLGGCARVRTALAVQPDDTVIGEIVIATPQKNADDTGPAITVPPELKSEVEVTPYEQDGYTGSVLRFSGLTFEQVGLLHQVAGPAGDTIQMQIRRAGNRVQVTGKVDLTQVSADRADFQLKISFPGDVLDTNGEVDSGTVSWTFTASEAEEFSAVVAYDDPNAPSALNWTIFLGVLVAIMAIGTIGLARYTRNPPVSPSSR